MTKEEIRKAIFAAVEEAVNDLLYDDRSNEDDNIPRGEIEAAVQQQVIGIWELVRCFEEQLRRKIPVTPGG